MALARRDHVLGVGVLDHRQHRAELLLVDQPRAFLDVAHDGRLDEIARPVQRVAAGDDLAVLPGVLEETLHLLVLHLVLQRPELGALLEPSSTTAVLASAPSSSQISS